jgi:hypothetical protein
MMRILFLLTLIAGASITRGQSSDELVETTFRVFPVLTADWEGIFYQPEPEAEMVEVVFRARNRSFYSYEYKGLPTLKFYREAGLDDEGVMQYNTVGRVQVVGPELLVFFTARKGDEAENMEFSTLAINDGPNGLPADYVGFVNLTSIRFACRFMDKDMVLQPGVNPPVSVKEKLAEDVFVGLAVTNQETHRVVMKNRWRFHEGNRHLILLLPPRTPDSYRIRAYRISEFVGENKRFNPDWTPPEIIGDGVNALEANQ